jgi:hypothetical protein
MLSGGVDSTFVAWKLLEEGHNVHLHHIKTSKKLQSDVEMLAAERIFYWLLEKYKNVSFSTSSLETNGFVCWDITNAAYIGAHVARAAVGKFFNINPYTDPLPDVCFGGELDLSEGFARRGGVAQDIFKACFKHEKQTPKFFSPADHIPKEDMVKQMPQQLLQMCWFCENPSIIRDHFAICGACHKCKLMTGLKKEQKLPNRDNKTETR